MHYKATNIMFNGFLKTFYVAKVAIVHKKIFFK